MPEQDTSENFSDKVLLTIFRYFLDFSPRHWPRLAHTCRKWRRIVFASQQALRLHLFCTYGTPVQKILDCWPTNLPIVLEYGGSPGLDPPTPEDEDNIMAALEQSDRVSSISLIVTGRLSELLFRIPRRFKFSQLKDLALLSQDNATQTPTSVFQPRRHPLTLIRITSGALSLFRFLRSSRNLVDLQLHNVFDTGFSMRMLTDALSRMTLLQSLDLRFTTDCTPDLSPRSGERRFDLSVLTRLIFRGSTRCLESLVAKIDAPRLGHIEVTFFDEVISEIPKLRGFINRIKLHKPHRRADILSSENAISISLSQSGAPTYLKIQLSCEPLAMQLFFMVRVCVQFSALLFYVEDLRISATRREASLRIGPCLEPRNFFSGVKWLHLLDTRRETVRSVLQKLYVTVPEPGLGYTTPYRVAAVPCKTSRHVSCHHIAVEYERLRHQGELRGEGASSPQVTIEMLCNDVLLNIFRHCLDATPQFWPTLGFVCQRWRQVILTSPLGLNLRLYFTHGTAVLNALDCWLVLPIIVTYGGFPNPDPPAPADDDNIIAALMQSGRVSSISLTFTSSLLEKVSAISEPFLELEELVLLSHDNIQLTLPSTFRWGPRLRTLHSTRIAFPSLPPLLSLCHDLSDIQLHEISSAGYFSPEAFANALSGMTHLRTLSLHFLSLPPRRNFLSFPPQPEECIVLPALTCLTYRGTSKYLDSFVARIDAPYLEEIDITFYSQPTMDTTQLGRFIGRIEMQTSLIRADINTSAYAISISFTNSNPSTLFRLQISCEQLDWQLHCMAQVCGQFFPFLFRVQNLSIKTTQSSSGQSDVNGGQWLELVRSFDGARDLWMADHLTTDILRALGRADVGHTSVLPALRHLLAENPMSIMNELALDALLIFINSRLVAGHPVYVNVPLSQCHICHASFRQQKGLDLHLVDMHAYRIMCSYCADFQCTPGHNDQFREHLEREHPILTRNDALISNPFLIPLQLDRLTNRHSSLRAPDIVAPSKTDHGAST